MADSAENWTIGRLLTWTAEYLKDQGSDSPRLDAEVLLAHARECQRIELYTAFDQPASPELRTRFRELVRQRAHGKPVAYLVGQREFFSLPLEVNQAVLIPRPETELLVLEILDRAAEASRTADSDERTAAQGPDWKILDVGCGSGAIAICAAKHLPLSQVTAVDISPLALEVARRNAHRHHVEARITFLESNLLDALPKGSQFDCIVSNPPYVSDQEMQELPRDVSDYEPEVALRGGGDGADVSRQLMTRAADMLKPGGWLILETSPMLASHLLRLLQEDPRYAQPAIRKDLANLARVVVARRASLPEPRPRG